MANIAVIGAGVVGLSTAVNIQNVIPGSKLKIISEKFDTDTTSYGSGGLFVPSHPSNPGVPVELFKKWIQRSWTFYQQLVTGPEAGECGAAMMTGYYLTKSKYKDPLYKDIVFSYRKLTDMELNKLGFPDVYKHGYQITTVVLDQKKYLKWLMKRILQKGAVFEKRKVNNMEEFVGRYDVVVNCTGLGSRELVGDAQMYPVKGHIVRGSKLKKTSRFSA